MTCFPQIAFAQVDKETYATLGATPRFESLTELSKHCPIDLRKDKRAGEYSFAESIVDPTKELGEHLVFLPRAVLQIELPPTLPAV